MINNIIDMYITDLKRIPIWILCIFSATSIIVTMLVHLPMYYIVGALLVLGIVLLISIKTIKQYGYWFVLLIAVLMLAGILMIDLVYELKTLIVK